jgi:hypothetical protein
MSPLSKWVLTLALLFCSAACGESSSIVGASKLCPNGKLVLVKSTWQCSISAQDAGAPNWGAAGAGIGAAGTAGTTTRPYPGGSGGSPAPGLARCESAESCQGRECVDGHCGDTCSDERCSEGRLCLSARYEECTTGIDCICRLCGRSKCELDEYCHEAESCLSRNGRCSGDSYCPDSNDRGIPASYCDKSATEELGRCAFRTPTLEGAVQGAESSIHFDAPSSGLSLDRAQDLIVTLKTVTGPTFVLLVGPLSSQSRSFNTDEIVSESMWAASLHRGGPRSVRWADGHGVRTSDSEWIDPPENVPPGMYMLLALELDDGAEIRKLSDQTPYIQIGAETATLKASATCMSSADCFAPINPQACIPSLRQCRTLCFSDSDCEAQDPPQRCHHGSFAFPYCVAN